jgi:Gram-negative bacterial TonB protein C-terminal
MFPLNAVMKARHLVLLLARLDPKDDSRGQGIIVATEVGRQGIAMRMHVLYSDGVGFDEKAVMAVHQLRFKPAVKDGAVVSTPMPLYIRVTVDH